MGSNLKEIKKIEHINELVLIIGDMNKHIGCDDLGVKGSHPKISFGGELLRRFCLNNR